MKKILIIALAVICVLGVSSSAKAYVLDPVLSPSSLSSGASPIWANLSLVTQNLAIPFVGTVSGGKVWFTGTLDSKVYADSTLGGNLMFTYQFTLAPNIGPGNVDKVSITSIGDFSGFTTDADVNGVAGYEMSRNTESSVNFNSLTLGGVAEGSTSPLYWIQTNAKSYTTGTTQLQGYGNTQIETFAPATPEPSSMLLLGMGVLGLFGLKRKKVA